jgi:hypothetical protein
LETPAPVSTGEASQLPDPASRSAVGFSSLAPGRGIRLQSFIFVVCEVDHIDQHRAADMLIFAVSYREEDAMRYVFYDKTSGVIVHTHQSFTLDKEQPQEVEEEDVRAIVSRLRHSDRLGVTRTEMPVVSSREATMSVDLKTGKVIKHSLVTDALGQQLAELHRKAVEEK